jgi:hypothetical protein
VAAILNIAGGAEAIRLIGRRTYIRREAQLPSWIDKMYLRRRQKGNVSTLLGRIIGSKKDGT